MDIHGRETLDRKGKELTIIPSWIVLVTRPPTCGHYQDLELIVKRIVPTSTAPANSQTAAAKQACFKVSEREATDVAKDYGPVVWRRNVHGEFAAVAVYHMVSRTETEK